MQLSSRKYDLIARRGAGLGERGVALPCFPFGRPTGILRKINLP